MSVAGALNTLWMLSCRRELDAFTRACARVKETQREILAGMVLRNRNTEFGRQHGFETVTSVAEFQKRVPLSAYSEYRESIDRIGAGATNVLTRDQVTLLEPTSGTSGAEKLVPYTRGLRDQFQGAIAAWIANLFSERPAVRKGRAYWSISPAFGERRATPGGIPIGFDDDTAYLGGIERLMIRRLLAVPSSVRLISDLEVFRYCTLLSLLRSADLSLISIWNPRFLIALLGSLESWWERLCADIRSGECNPPRRPAGAIPPGWAAHSPPNPRRADQLLSIHQGNGNLLGKLAETWPRLALISCWADAAAARQVEDLKDLFPSVEIQPKGLLATEGVVSIPLAGRAGCALALRSHFFEFEECGSREIRLAHELKAGARYRVVITTGGGLYRYQLQDEIEVAGFERECPLLIFIGKSDQTSDLVGEKLSEPHVRESLDAVFGEHGISPRFALLAPEEKPVPRYCLYLQDARLSTARADAIARGLHERLEANPHYRYAVGLGQLAPLRGQLLESGGVNAWAILERRKAELGQKPGGIKTVALERGMNWKMDFAPLTIESNPNGGSCHETCTGATVPGGGLHGAQRGRPDSRNAGGSES